MNMSHPDQVELWRSLMNGMLLNDLQFFYYFSVAWFPVSIFFELYFIEILCYDLNVLYLFTGKLEAYNRISSKLKLGIIGDEFSGKPNPSTLKSQHSVDETEATAATKASMFVSFNVIIIWVGCTAFFSSCFLIKGGKMGELDLERSVNGSKQVQFETSQF